MPKPDVAMLACNEQSPKDEKVYARVRCNRIAGHVGPHRKVRAYDFVTLAEWQNGRYSLLPNGEAVAEEELPS